MCRTVTATCVLTAILGLGLTAQRFIPAEGADALHVPLDQILDVNVRDGLVYYRALKSDRSRLDRYIASLNVPAATYGGWSRDQKIAFWLNAYDAFVLETVIDNYPIRSRSTSLPASSIKQIPGAFEQTKHRAAGRSVTLDEIEKTILPEFKDARLFLALGRGAIGSGRLRSEAFTAERLKRQLETVQAEFVNETEMLQIDRLANQVTVTSILSWREADFVASFDPGATGTFSQRSPLERAMVAFVLPHLLPLEKEMLQKNDFKMAFRPFDWKLNDLTGRGE